MTCYLLDTKILNSILSATASPSLIAWLDGQPDESLYICSMNLAEIWNGILALAAGEKRSEMEGWFTGPRGPRVLFGNRVLAFDEKASLVWARLVSEREQARLPCGPIDMIYAAIAEANHCTLVTDNEEGFAGLSFINPTRLAQ
ncbi:MAG TPA: PIN domain-containing protein [Terracidiphilus sp.]